MAEGVLDVFGYPVPILQFGNTMAMTLRDMLTGAIPGNPLANIPLGDPKDPQANKFTYNIFGSLGPGAGVDTGMSRLFGGFSGTEPGAASPSTSRLGGGGKPPPDFNKMFGQFQGNNWMGNNPNTPTGVGGLDKYGPSMDTGNRANLPIGSPGLDVYGGGAYGSQGRGLRGRMTTRNRSPFGAMFG